MSYVEHTWGPGKEAITNEKLNNIESGIVEALQSGGSGGVDAIIYYNDTEDIDQVVGSFTSVVTKITSGSFPVIITGDIVEEDGSLIFSQLIPVNYIYDPSEEKITVPLSENTGYYWTANGVEYYEND